MRKLVLVFSSCSLIVMAGIGLFGCKDDEPYVKPNLSLKTGDLSVNEDAGFIEVALALDKPAIADLVVGYTIGGSAEAPEDYGIVGKDGEITIKKGETNVAVKIEIANDVLFEERETIEISFQNTQDDDMVLTGTADVTITINDDDIRIELAFASTTMTVSESDGIIEIPVTLTDPAPGDIFLKYSLSGTAIDSVLGNSSDPTVPVDFAVQGGTPGQLYIAQGQKTGSIRLKMISDFLLEDNDVTTDALDPETIIATLTEVTHSVQISPSNNQMIIDVKQEDGKVIGLYWDKNIAVDMDLILWEGTTNDISEMNIVGGSAQISEDGAEQIIIPASKPNRFYGTSYVYYSGNATPLNFEIQFKDLVDGNFTPLDEYSASYTLANKNRWVNITDIKYIEQTFHIVDGQLTNISAISVPAEGSRIAAPASSKKSKKNDFSLRK